MIWFGGAQDRRGEGALIWGSGCPEATRGQALLRESEAREGRTPEVLGTEKGSERWSESSRAGGHRPGAECRRRRGSGPGHAPGGRNHRCSSPPLAAKSRPGPAAPSCSPSSDSRARLSWPEVGGARVLGNPAAGRLLRTALSRVGGAQRSRDQALAVERRESESALPAGSVRRRWTRAPRSRRHGSGRQRRAARGRRGGLPPARGESAIVGGPQSPADGWLAVPRAGSMLPGPGPSGCGRGRARRPRQVPAMPEAGRLLVALGGGALPVKSVPARSVLSVVTPAGLGRARSAEARVSRVGQGPRQRWARFPACRGREGCRGEDCCDAAREAGAGGRRYSAEASANACSSGVRSVLTPGSPARRGGECLLGEAPGKWRRMGFPFGLRS